MTLGCIFPALDCEIDIGLLFVEKIVEDIPIVVSSYIYLHGQYESLTLRLDRASDTAFLWPEEDIAGSFDSPAKVPEDQMTAACWRSKQKSTHLDEFG